MSSEMRREIIEEKPAHGSGFAQQKGGERGQGTSLWGGGGRCGGAILAASRFALPATAVSVTANETDDDLK